MQLSINSFNIVFILLFWYHKYITNILGIHWSFLSICIITFYSYTCWFPVCHDYSASHYNAIILLYNSSYAIHVCKQTLIFNTSFNASVHLLHLWYISIMTYLQNTTEYYKTGIEQICVNLVRLLSLNLLRKIFMNLLFPCSLISHFTLSCFNYSFTRNKFIYL